MNNLLEYKEYYGTVEFSDADNVFFGKIIGIRGLISYEGDSVKSLTEDFRNAVDEYLEFCADNNKIPERSSFSVNISPELYNMAAWHANQKGLPLNIFVENVIKTNIFSKGE